MLNTYDSISIAVIIISGFSLRKAHLSYHVRMNKKGFYSPLEWKKFNSNERLWLSLFWIGVIALFLLEVIK